jgi:hypothetical protein
MNMTAKQLFISQRTEFVQCLRNYVKQVLYNHLETRGQVSFVIEKITVIDF